MAVKFFGQFLVDEGMIDARQLQDVDDHTYYVHRTLGELAVRRGLVSQADIDRVLRLQSTTDRYVGELLIQQKLLSQEQLEGLLEHQRHNHARVGEVLIEMGHLDKTTLRRALLRYRNDQAQYDTDVRVLPGGLSHSPAELVLDLLPRIALRVAGIHVRFGDISDASASRDDDVCVGARVPTPCGFALGLGCSARLARALSGQARGSVEPDLSEPEMRDAVVAFMDRLARQVHPGAKPSEWGWLPEGGYVFDFITTRGNGRLVMQSQAVPDAQT